MQSLQFRLTRTVVLLPLILWLCGILCSCTPNVTHQFSVEASQYLPQVVALEYASHYFDVTTHGILLKTYTNPFFSKKEEHKRFPFNELNLTVEDIGGWPSRHHSYCVIVRHDTNTGLNYGLGWYEQVLVFHGDTKTLMSKLTTALLSLGIKLR